MISGLFSLPIAGPDAACEADGRLRAAGGGSPNCFIAGPENALIRSLVKAVSTRTIAANPIVLYGPTGVGKSTIAQFLAVRRQERHKGAKTITTTGAQFAQALAQAIDSGAATDFRTRHHRCDVLLIDDVQHLAGKPAAQQFLVSTLDALIGRSSLVIATLRRTPQQTAGISRALASRLAGGLVVPVALPGYETRRELVRQTAQRIGLALPAAAVDRLAGDARRPATGFVTAAHLRHAVLQIGASQAASRSAGAALDQLISASPAPKAIFRQVALVVAKHAGVTTSELKSATRRQAVAEPRSLAMYLARQITGASYAEIGKFFGGRDHTTVLYACRRVATTIAHDNSLRRTADELATQITAEGIA